MIYSYFLFSGKGGFDRTTIAKAMLETIIDFAGRKPDNLKLVRIAVFPRQPDILEIFRNISEDVSRKKQSWLGTLVDSLRM